MKTLIMTLVCPYTGRKHPVEMWGDYGIVAPSLWTTNGHISFVSRLLWDLLQEPTPEEPRFKPYTIEDCALPGESFDSAEKLTAALLRFYHDHK